MKPQNYNNHSRYYAAHHFVFYGLSLILLIVCIYQGLNNGNTAVWFTLAFMTLMLVFLSLMLRQHYSLGNQNRIVRLEMRFRYYVLTHKRFEEIEKVLSKGQIFALRFAPDEELPALVERAVKENLSPDTIKRSIKNWLPDHMRV
jgi:hypothetical protein